MHAVSSDATAARRATLTAARTTDEAHAVTAVAAVAAVDPAAIRAALSSPAMHLHTRLVHDPGGLIILGAKVPSPERGRRLMVSRLPLLLRLPRVQHAAATVAAAEPSRAAAAATRASVAAPLALRWV